MPKEVELPEINISSSDPIKEVETPLHNLKNFFIGMKLILLEHKILYLFLLTIPFSIISNFFWNNIITFILCMFSIIPLSKLLGSATEQLAFHTGQTIGGLLNATFGNAVELIISIIALKDGLLRIVQASLLGSILSNLLLVMGMSFLIGGTRYKIQLFNQTAAQTQSSLLLVTLMAILLPTAFFLSPLSSSNTSISYETKVLELSHIVAIVMLIVYAAYLLFQLKTHKHLFEDVDKIQMKDNRIRYNFKFLNFFKKNKENKEEKEEREEENKEESEEEEEEEEEEKKESPKLSIWGAVVLLALSTVLVAILSEYLVGSIESVVQNLHITETFIGIIIIPIVGNAAEHVTAVSVAAKNKMDLSIGVALGSSIQISLFVIPLMVVVGWAIGQPLTLNFYTFETVTLFVGVVIANAVINDGQSNWLEGIFLMGTYISIAAGFYYHS